MIDLPARAKLRGLRVRFLRDQRNWIFLPARVRFELAGPNGARETVYEAGDRATVEQRAEMVGVTAHAASFEARAASRLRITAESVGIVPVWHRGAGGKAWVFVDEIAVE